MHGVAGCGKTCAMALLYSIWPGEAIWLRLDETSRLIGEARRSPTGFTTAWEDGKSFEWWESNFWQRIDRASLVCVDEIGSSRGLHQEVLLELLDRRTQKPLILTSNDNPEGMLTKDVDPRIVSRLTAGMFVSCGVEDLR